MAVLPREQAGGKTQFSPFMCKVRPEVHSVHTFFLAVVGRGYLGWSRRTGRAIGMFPKNIVPSSNNLQRGDFGSPIGIVVCKGLASLSSTNISSCFVNPFSMYSLRGGK